ncbi:hypothetical protein niasHS_002839 [Heterodera schachtii]|uniref:Uncharacterized protein n=1 Tax=Heterodera schachtii TaxID=97005 RepID=A0ABD2K2R4_HETSC
MQSADYEDDDDNIVPMPMEQQQIPPIDEPMPSPSSPIYKAEQKRILHGIFDCLFGKLCMKFTSHKSAIKGLEKKIGEIVGQMMFSSATELEHLKEVMKSVLFMKRILEIIKQNKEKTHVAIDNIKTNCQKRTDREEAINKEKKQLNYDRKAQQKMKVDTLKIEREKNPLFLEFVRKCQTNNAAYNNAVNDWFYETVKSQSPEAVDKWEEVNGDINEARANWKLKEALTKNNVLIETVNKIRADPSTVTNEFFPESVLYMHSDVIMEWKVRKEFVEVVANAMRNYAAISQAMDSEEISTYFKLFEPPPENGSVRFFHPAIRCKRNENKRFDQTFDKQFDQQIHISTEEKEEKKQRIHQSVMKAVQKRQNSKTKSQKIGDKWVRQVSSKSKEWHFATIESTIKEYSRKCLLARTRAIRTKAMEVLKIAVFLREFDKKILTTNPDPSIKNKVEEKKKTCEKEIEHLNREIEKTTATYNNNNNIPVNSQPSAEVQERADNWQTEGEGQQNDFLLAQSLENVLSSEEEGSPYSRSTVHRRTNYGRRRKRMDRRTGERNPILLESYKIKLVDAENRKRQREKQLEKAKKELENVNKSYKEAQKKAKKLIKYLEKEGDGDKKKNTLRKVIEEIEKEKSFENEDQAQHFYVAAFDNWKQETLTTYSIQLPKYVVDNLLIEGNYSTETVVREANDEMEQLLAQVQLEARREFQSFASNVVINYALISKSMTGAEVEYCAEVLSWFNEVHVELEHQYLVDANGRFKDSEQKHNIGATRWACPNDAMGLLERCGTESARRRKGCTTQFVHKDESDEQPHIRTAQEAGGRARYDDDDDDDLRTDNEVAPRGPYTGTESEYTGTEYVGTDSEFEHALPRHSVGRYLPSETETVTTEDQQGRFMSESEASEWSRGYNQQEQRHFSSASSFASSSNFGAPTGAAPAAPFRGYASTTETEKASSSVPPSSSRSSKAPPSLSTVPKPKDSHGYFATDSSSAGPLPKKGGAKIDLAKSRRTINNGTGDGTDAKLRKS